MRSGNRADGLRQVSGLVELAPLSRVKMIFIVHRVDKVRLDSPRAELVVADFGPT